MRAHVFQCDPRRPWLAQRSARSLRAAGFELGEPQEGPCLLLKAGYVLHKPHSFTPPPTWSSGSLIAVGLPVDGTWLDFHRAHGGDYPTISPLPPPLCEWHSSGPNASARLNGERVPEPCRAIHWSPLDLAATTPTISVFQVVTSLQHGGAEKIARDLALGLSHGGVRARLVTLGKPNRTPLNSPSTTVDLSQIPRANRASELSKRAIAQGVDVLHVHLTDADETRALAASGIPVIATVHNARAGWPRGWETLRRGDLSLMLACSQSTEVDLRQIIPDVPVRTVWNGINPHEFPSTPLPATTHGFVLACVANPRPQKRLHLLPAILAETRLELRRRGRAEMKVRLVIAGETSPHLADAIACRTEVEDESQKHGVSDDITWTEGRVPVQQVLAESHAVVSCSAYEGLSLAHLEAISSGRPLVACDTGGTRELAWRNPSVKLMKADASVPDFARAIVSALLEPPPSAHSMVWRDFTTERMVARIRRFAHIAACRSDHPETLWFITNNLSTGGAQSSLRRLTQSYHENGHRVRIALLQEYPDHPTQGRLEVIKHGIQVFVPPPAGLITPDESVELILAEMAADPPAAVIFWNAITSHKLLLADALCFAHVYDVSPGEMWFSAFEHSIADPPKGLPCRSPTDYGRLLTSFVVKYAAEAQRAMAFGTSVKVIPNGVMLPPSPQRRPQVAGPFVFGTAARISPQKRLDELIAAFRIAINDIPDSVLRIVGGVESGANACADELRALSDGFAIEWLGETHDIASFHATCDVFVMISDPAGCPNASLEALASGLPVIATDVGGASEQIIHGVNGLLVPPRDVAALARAMVEISADSAKRDAMSVAARDHIRQHFTLEQMTANYQATLLPHLTAGARARNPR